MKKIEQFLEQRTRAAKLLREYRAKIMEMERDLYTCIDCCDHFGGYMVEEHIWLEAIPDYAEFKKAPNTTNQVQICLPCLEKRLKRKLVREDFSDLPINKSLLYMMSGH